MKKLLKYLLIIIGVLVLLYLIWIAVNTKWLDLERKTYENSRYGFSVSYPQDWILGAQETNNAGREFYSPDKKIVCRAYGFANALTNKKGEPQSLDEFIIWLTNDGSSEVLQKGNATLSGKKAIRLLTQENNQYKEAIYTLGKGSGIGFYCAYKNLEASQQDRKFFNQISKSFSIKSNLDE